MRRRQPSRRSDHAIGQHILYDGHVGPLGATGSGIPSSYLLARRLELGPYSVANGPFRQIGGNSIHNSNQAIYRRQYPAGIRVDGSLQIHDSHPQIFTRPCRFVFWIEIAGASAHSDPNPQSE
jgi:hypothetical protein